MAKREKGQCVICDADTPSKLIETCSLRCAKIRNSQLEHYRRHPSDRDDWVTDMVQKLLQNRQNFDHRHKEDKK